MLPLRCESNGLVPSPMDQVFAHVDVGVELSVEEIVRERSPRRRKVWDLHRVRAAGKRIRP